MYIRKEDIKLLQIVLVFLPALFLVRYLKAFVEVNEMLIIICSYIFLIVFVGRLFIKLNEKYWGKIIGEYNDDYLLIYGHKLEWSRVKEWNEVKKTHNALTITGILSMVVLGLRHRKIYINYPNKKIMVNYAPKKLAECLEKHLDCYNSNLVYSDDTANLIEL